jgi:ferrous iron transport protein A
VIIDINIDYINSFPPEKKMVTRTSQIPLAELVAGEQATILSFQNMREVTGRLTSLGFTPSARVVMMQNHGRGPLLVTVRGTHVALGRGEAQKIIVQRVSE